MLRKYGVALVGLVVMPMILYLQTHSPSYIENPQTLKRKIHITSSFNTHIFYGDNHTSVFQSLDV